MLRDELVWPDDIKGIFDYFSKNIEPLITQENYIKAIKLLDNIKMQMTFACTMISLSPNATGAYVFHLAGIFVQLRAACETGNKDCINKTLAELKSYYQKDLVIPKDPEFDRVWRSSLCPKPPA